jgi:hypothetical protein
LSSLDVIFLGVKKYKTNFGNLINPELFFEHINIERKPGQQIYNITYLKNNTNHHTF